MTTQFQQVEPLNDLHHDKIIEAFSRLFVNRGGLSDGWGDGDGDGSGYGYGYGCGDGWGYGFGYGDGNVPEEWLVKP